MLSGVIFDMDGVLIDSHPAHKVAWRRFLSEVGKDVSDSELAFVLDGRKRQDILHHFLGDLDEQQLSEFGRRKDEYFLALAGTIETVRGLLPFLNELEESRIPKAVATSAMPSRAHSMLTRLALKQRFSAVVTGQDVVHGKPHPAIFQLAGERLGVCPDNLLVIEDAVSGVRAAKAAGMKCLGISSGEHARALLAAGADYVSPDFESLALADLQTLFN